MRDGWRGDPPRTCQGRESSRPQGGFWGCSHSACTKMRSSQNGSILHKTIAGAFPTSVLHILLLICTTRT
eukprot:9194041-Pyramimonas_sp.AAC.1